MTRRIRHIALIWVLYSSTLGHASISVCHQKNQLLSLVGFGLLPQSVHVGCREVGRVGDKTWCEVTVNAATLIDNSRVMS